MLGEQTKMGLVMPESPRRSQTTSRNVSSCPDWSSPAQTESLCRLVGAAMTLQLIFSIRGRPSGAFTLDL